MRIALTGASGFIGRALVTALEAAGREFVAVGLRAPRRLPHPAGIGAVIHLAAIAHRRGAHAKALQSVNVDLAGEVGRWAAAGGMHMLFVSSVKVHGERSLTPFTEGAPLAPGDPYARSKARAEAALRAVPGLRLTVLRPPLVYGPGVKANFLALVHAMARGVPLPLAGIANRRSLIYVENLVDAILHLLERAGGETYLLSDGEALSTGELCVALGQALGRPARLFRFPAALLPRKLIASLEIDGSALRRTGWRPPFSTDQGLALTAKWYWSALHGR